MIRWNNIEIIKPKQGQNVLLFCGNINSQQPVIRLISGTYEIDDDKEYYETYLGARQLREYLYWTDVLELDLPIIN